MPTATVPVPQGATFEPVDPTTATPGNVPVPAGATFSPVSEPVPPPEDDAPGFLQRAYETSPIKTLVDAAKNKWDSIQQEQAEDDQVRKQVIDLVKTGDYGRASETLLSHMTKGLGHDLGQAALDSNPANRMVLNIAKSTYQHGKAAYEAGAQGNVGEAIAQGAEAVPVVGSIAEQVGEPLGKDLREGNYSGAAGDVAGGATTIGSLLLGKESGAADESLASKATTGLRPKVTAEGVPVRASVANPGVVTQTAEKLADREALLKQDLTQTQPAVRGAVAKTAADLTNTPAAVPTETDPFGFKGTADAVANRSKDVFQKLDELSGGKFSDAQEEAADARGDYTVAGRKAYRQALSKQDAIFDKFSGGNLTPPAEPIPQTVESSILDAKGAPIKNEAVSPEDQAKYDAAKQDFDTATANKDAFKPGELDQAKADWKQSQALLDLKKRFDPAITPVPDELAKLGEPDTGYVSGKNFRARVQDAMQAGEFKDAGFSPEHINTFKELGKTLEKQQNVLRFNAITRLMAKMSPMATGHLGTAAEITGAVTGGELTVGRVLGKIMTNPKALATLNTGLRSGASVPLIIQALRSNLRPVNDSPANSDSQ